MIQRYRCLARGGPGSGDTGRLFCAVFTLSDRQVYHVWDVMARPITCFLLPPLRASTLRLQTDLAVVCMGLLKTVRAEWQLSPKDARHPKRRDNTADPTIRNFTERLGGVIGFTPVRRLPRAGTE